VIPEVHAREVSSYMLIGQSISFGIYDATTVIGSFETSWTPAPPY